MNESSSFLLRLFLRSLGAGHPVRLCIGVSVGVVVKIVVDGEASAYPGSAFLKAVSAYQLYWFLIACSPLAFIPMVIGKRNAPESVVHTINTIQALLDRAKLSKPNEQIFWRAVLEKFVAAAKPDLSGAADPKKLFEDASKEISISNDQTPS